MEKFEWSALEYEERERTGDSLWALGIIICASGIASIIFGNYFFAGLIVIAGSLLWFYAKKKPDFVHYELGEKGIRIRDRIYPYENIKGFFAQKESAPALFIRTERGFMPMIAIPIDLDWAEDMGEFMLSKNIPEEEMREHLSEKIMEVLGF